MAVETEDREAIQAVTVIDDNPGLQIERRTQARRYLPVKAQYSASWEMMTPEPVRKRVKNGYAIHPKGVKYQSLIHFAGVEPITLEPGDDIEVITGMQLDLTKAEYIALVTPHPSLGRLGLVIPGQFHVLPPGGTTDVVFPLLNLHPYNIVTLNPGTVVANLTLVRCLPHEVVF